MDIDYFVCIGSVVEMKDLVRIVDKIGTMVIVGSILLLVCIPIPVAVYALALQDSVAMAIVACVWVVSVEAALVVAFFSRWRQ